MTNVVNVKFPRTCPEWALIKMAEECTQSPWPWVEKDYGMLQSYLEQWVDDPSVITYEMWVGMVKTEKRKHLSVVK